MGERTLRGARLGGQSFEDERGIEFAARQNVAYVCRQGHEFATLWIPGVKLTAIDLGVARIQRCPVGRHWSLVTPVRQTT